MRSENKKSGIYITACCLSVIAAVIGFSGRKTKKEDGKEQTKEFLPEIQADVPEREPLIEVEKNRD